MFGSGFAISFVIVWYIAAYLVNPLFVETQLGYTGSGQSSNAQTTVPSSVSTQNETFGDRALPFHELELEEQIREASVVALARYEPSTDGKVKAIIREFLKKDPDTIFYYDIGDEYESSSYYPKSNTSYGNGIIIFFTGSPATMRMSMTYSGDRIRGLGDLPVELLRKKCKEAGA